VTISSVADQKLTIEIGFRWKYRKATDELRREAALKQISGKRLKYKTSA
jgi:hypothetical protein